MLTSGKGSKIYQGNIRSTDPIIESGDFQLLFQFAILLRVEKVLQVSSYNPSSTWFKLPVTIQVKT